MRWSARAPLRKRLDALMKLQPPEDLQRLRDSFQAEGKPKIRRHYAGQGPVGLALAQLPMAELRAELQAMPPEGRSLLLHAAIAWTARALGLVELMEAQQIEPASPAKWAGDQMLQALAHLEGDAGWLWPYATEAPWPDDEDEDPEEP
jgi:hypothetical protein